MRFIAGMRITGLFIILMLTVFWLKAQETAVVFGKVNDIENKPAVGVSIVLKSNFAIGTTTSSEGEYSLTVPAGKHIYLIFTQVGSKSDTVPLPKLKPGQQFKLDRDLKKKTIEIPIVEVTADPNRETGTVIIDAAEIDKLPNPIGGIEGILLATGLAASSNELSSSYTVRGGNFDENLVYVNDFEVFRPFLIRSGQQEGLSFINPDMVDRIEFSAGGFQPKYGDKMASVLSVDYKQSKRKFGGSASGSFMGATAHVEGAVKSKKDKIGTRFTYLAGVRYRTLQYLLNSLETTGAYSPTFVDFQSFLTYKFHPKWQVELLTNYARNQYSFVPVDRETTFGVVNEVLQLTMYFEGQENDNYESFMSGMAFVQRPNDKLTLKYMGSYYRILEIEAYDILAEYWLGEVETDFSDDDFGQVRYSLGAGGLQDFARNILQTQVANFQHRGKWVNPKHTLEWGAKYQHEIIKDHINEWERFDSAGYNLPIIPRDEVNVERVLKSDFDLNSHRLSGFFQDSWRLTGERELTLTYGARVTWWDVNNEFVASPRVQFSFKPTAVKSDLLVRAAVGMYVQPPFYREMRALDGTVNTNLKAQKSFHAVLSTDINFKAWDRDFKFVAEAYYKYLWDLVPYEFDNVLIRYYGVNQAKGYVAGIDLRLHGEFVKSTDSYVSLSLMSTKEDIEGDSYYKYYDENGNQVLSTSRDIVDSTIQYPGFIPRPTDQRVRFTLFFQDYIPKNDNFKMHLKLIFATGLPFGPPDNDRYKDVLRIPPYRRVDIGFSALLYDQERKKEKDKEIKGMGKAFTTVWATLEIWNLLGVNNTVSYLWIKDISNTVYAVPNFLTARRVNLRVIFKF